LTDVSGALACEQRAERRGHQRGGERGEREREQSAHAEGLVTPTV
jgi:hypothetical protein